MIQFLADENLHGPLLKALRKHLSGDDMVRAWDVGLAGKTDPEVLEWAAQHQRIILTHDVRTMITFAMDRVAAGLPMPGVFEIS